MLGIARRNDDEPTHRVVAGVPEGVGHAPRNKDEAAARDRELAVPQQKRRFPARYEERFVGVRVSVKRRSRVARRQPADECDVGSRRLRWPEGDGLVGLGGRNDGALIDSLHRLESNLARHTENQPLLVAENGPRAPSRGTVLRSPPLPE
jgi:hypothetical protein